MSIACGQNGIQQWFHPIEYNYFDGDSIDSISHIELSNNYHIGMISYNDSLNIYDKTETFKFLKNIKNTSYRLNIIRHNSVIEFLQPQYSLRVDNSYDEILIRLVHQKNNFKLDLELLKFSSVDGISPLLSISYTPLPWLKIIGGKRIKKPISLKMNYIDFNFEVNDNYIDFESYHYSVSMINKTNKLKYLVENGKWGIPSTDNISTKNGIKKYSELSASFYFKENRRLNLVYKTNLSSGSIDFRKDSNRSFLKINKSMFENMNSLIEYHFIFSRFKIKTAINLKKLNFYLSNRIRPSRVIPELNYILALFLDNQTIGELKSRAISIQLFPKEKRSFSPFMKIDWLVDSYDVNLEVSISQLIPYLRFTNDQDLAVIGKKAINFGFGYEISYFNNWLINLSFSQHIPYEISLIKSDDAIDDGPISDLIDSMPNAESIINDFENTLTNDGNYGGGLFQFTIRKYFD